MLAHTRLRTHSAARVCCAVQIYMYVHGFSEGSSAGGAQSMPGQTTKPVRPEGNPNPNPKPDPNPDPNPNPNN